MTRIKCCRAGLVLAASLFLGCGPPTDELSEIDSAVTGSFTLDFESDALGPLSSAWTTVKDSSSSPSSASIINTADHGHVLQVHGSPAVPNYLVAAFHFTNSTTHIENSFDINPASGASFVWSFLGSGQARWIRLQRGPGSQILEAYTAPSGGTNCGILASDAWSNVTLVMHADQLPHTFDVLINGAATACTGLSTSLTAPYTGVSMLDASNAGWGGNVMLDNIVVGAP